MEGMSYVKKNLKLESGAYCMNKTTANPVQR